MEVAEGVLDQHAGAQGGESERGGGCSGNQQDAGAGDEGEVAELAGGMHAVLSGGVPGSVVATQKLQPLAIPLRPSLLALRWRAVATSAAFV